MAKVSLTMKASIEKVWDALVRPELIKKWLFGTDTITDWMPGSPILWHGEWDGKKYEDKGRVLEVRKPARLSYTHWSTFSGKPDVPENYVTIVCDLEDQGAMTLLTVTQNCPEEEREKCEHAWSTVLKNLQNLF